MRWQHFSHKIHFKIWTRDSFIVILCCYLCKINRTSVNPLPTFYHTKLNLTADAFSITLFRIDKPTYNLIYVQKCWIFTMSLIENISSSVWNMPRMSLIWEITCKSSRISQRSPPNPSGHKQIAPWSDGKHLPPCLHGKRPHRSITHSSVIHKIYTFNSIQIELNLSNFFVNL